MPCSKYGLLLLCQESLRLFGVSSMIEYPRYRTLLQGAHLFALFLFLHADLFAGPKPGEITKEEVSPQTAQLEHIDIEKSSEGLYNVTIRWSPDFEVIDPIVAGSFNEWSRSANPFKKIEGEEAYEVSLELPAGEYEYKFVSQPDDWHSDPLNPEVAEGYRNSILRLGDIAYFASLKGEQNDGVLFVDALEHDPKNRLYFDIQDTHDVYIRFRTIRNDATAAELQLLTQGKVLESKPMVKVTSEGFFDYYDYHLTLPREPVHPSVRITDYRFVVHDGDSQSHQTDSWEMFLDRKDHVQVPMWAKDAIWYQIMVDRFRDGSEQNNMEHLNDPFKTNWTSMWKADHMVLQPWEQHEGATLFTADGNENVMPDIYERMYGGDLQGVIEKLDYLADLGVNAIYFNPIFQAPSHHKYDGEVYHHIDDSYGVAGSFAKSIESEDPAAGPWEFNGSDQVFLDLLKEAKKRNIRVIIDGVFNHLSDQSLFFRDVKEKGKASPYADWFEIASWDPVTPVGWAGYGGMPQFLKNEEHGLASKEVRDYIYDITERWMDPNNDGDPSDGVDGWRLDVPMDVPMVFWENWRDHIKSINPEALLIGEIWNSAEKWVDGTTFDAVMNYQFRRVALRFFGNEKNRISAEEFANELAWLRIRYPMASGFVMQNLLDSHDTDRISSRLMNPDIEADALFDGWNRLQEPEGKDFYGGRPTEEAYERLKLLSLFQFTYIGAPMIYYGTEVGMYGADDPLCRFPMWWEDMMPYENPDYQIKDDLFAHYQELAQMRRGCTLLRRGDFRTVAFDNDQETFVFERYLEDQDERVYVFLNNSEEPQTVGIGQLPHFSFHKVLFGNHQNISFDMDKLEVTLQPVTGAVVKLMTMKSADDNI